MKVIIVGGVAGGASCAARLRITHWDSAGKGFLLDVRESLELAVEQAPGAARRAPPGPGDPGHLPVRPARLHCDAGSFAERIRGQECIRRDAFPCAQLPVQYGQQIVHE